MRLFHQGIAEEMGTGTSINCWWRLWRRTAMSMIGRKT
jgi:hypothetical protein